MHKKQIEGFENNYIYGMMRKYMFTVVSLYATMVMGQGINPFQYSIVKKMEPQKAAVVSAHPLASAAGVSILQKGGNAIDAAIATQLALAVVYPGAGNIGGGGFMVAHLKNGKNLSIDYREKAPSKAGRDMYLDKDGKVMQGKSILGHLASGVPGTIAGLFASHRYAKLPFEELIAPAILLSKGFVITEKEAKSLNGMKNIFVQHNTVRPAFVKDQPWKAGDTLVQPDLEKTLLRIQKDGQKGFYEGETAKLIVEEMQRGGGIISLEDLKNYQAAERTPVVFDYKGHTIVTMPLPSSGGILLPQLLKMTSKSDLGQLGFHSASAVQWMVEAERRGFADRAEYLGDPDFVKVPVKILTSEAYLEERMKDFIPGKAGSSDLTKPGTVPESEETTHLSVLDQWGNAVSVTTTLNGGYGSATVVGGAGFLMNNEMDDFSIKPGEPNMYGALGTEANAIQPDKRMLSSMAPTVVLKKKKAFMVVGTPGGTTIPTSVYQSIVNVIDFGMDAEDAVNKPKFHHQWKPDRIDVEQDFPQQTIEDLKKMGYQIFNRGAIGRTEMILIKKKKIQAVADKRGDDAVAGF